MHPYNEMISGTSPLNIKIAFYTKEGGYAPLHWHDFLEILYPLNGESDIMVEGITHRQKNKQPLVIDSGKIHSTHHYGKNAMFLCIHIAKENLEWYFPKIQDFQVHCYPDSIPDSVFPEYLKICDYLKQITELYITDSPTFLLESEGLVLETLSKLILNFSTDSSPLLKATDKLYLNRIREIIAYVESHFAEPISLQDGADLLGLGKEYFCRFFKKNMGISFLQYINQVRAAHIYQDLIHTDESILFLMEKNGFNNQKLFNHTFKTLYGCTPSQIRSNVNTP